MRLSLLCASSRWPRRPRRTCSVGWRPPAAARSTDGQPGPASEVKAEKKPSSILDLIERAGNKVPHPAILFGALCVAVIMLSQILYLAGARITTEVVKPPPAAVQEEYVGGSVLPAYQLPAEP